MNKGTRGSHLEKKKNNKQTKLKSLAAGEDGQNMEERRSNFNFFSSFISFLDSRKPVRQNSSR